METIYKYNTTTEALNFLKEKGYYTDFNVEFEQLEEQQDSFVIDYIYRYEGMTDPSDEAWVYGIKNTATGEKGVLVLGNLSFVEGRKRDIILALEAKSK